MLLVQKEETCRRQARQQKLTFLKRRRFIRDCIKKKPESMIPKSLSSTPIGDGSRFSEKIMLKQNVRAWL